MKDDLRYTPSDCFETFPFPEDWESRPDLETAGKTYYDFRADLMVRNDEGLTKTYNRFHDPEEDSPDIIKLRELHAAMDRAVLDAYGWTDIPTACEFLLDYEVDEEESGRRKKPWRYRWPDEVRRGARPAPGAQRAARGAGGLGRRGGRRDQGPQGQAAAAGTPRLGDAVLRRGCRPPSPLHALRGTADLRPHQSVVTRPRCCRPEDSSIDWYLRVAQALVRESAE